MKKISNVIIGLLFLSGLGIYLWLKSPKPHEPTPPPPVKPEIDLHLKSDTYDKLPGWQQAKLQNSFQVLKNSCALFLRRDPERSAGTDLIPLTVADWLPACKAAEFVNATNNSEIKKYFEKWFAPYVIAKEEPLDGLFTGYYSLNLEGSPEKTEKYKVPLYSLPDDLAIMQLQDFDKDLPRRKIITQVEGHRLKPYVTRKAIDNGALKGKAKPIAWIESPVDRVFLEIQGSGVITFDDGSKHYLGYAGENGAPYTPIAKVLIDKGVMTRDNASMQGIKRYLEQHPKEMDEVLHANKSFVFFQEQTQAGALGAQGLPLTPGVSMAVDLRHIPLGVPLWLSTTYTDMERQEQTLQRLMVAQDTGGAIRGPVRGDVYWGDDFKASQLAGRMKHPGQYWVLLPKTSLNTASNI